MATGAWSEPTREALYYERLPGERVHCLLCPQGCRIKEGGLGVCRVRVNRGGTLYSANYGRVASYGLDPIEKKPLYHFHPGSQIFSLGALGCNLSCGFCQNWQISQEDSSTVTMMPEEAVEMAARMSGKTACIGLAYTYSEPIMWYEYVLEASSLAKERGLANVLVTNGYVNPEPLAELLPHVDALNVDVKAFRDEFYRKVCGGKLPPVLLTVEAARRAGCHVELTTLLIPGLNDEEDEIRELVDWVADLGPDIPVHFSRYFPAYKMERPPTPVETLRRARAIAREKLHHVYIGNVPGNDGNETICQACGKPVITRRGFAPVSYRLDGKRCGQCGAGIALVGEIH